MRVAQLVMARQYRGAEIFAAQLSRELIKQGVEICYISLYKNNSGQQFIPQGIDFKDLDAIKEGRFSFSLLRKLADTLKEFNPGIVQANAGDTLKYAVVVKLLYRRKYKIVFRNASTVSRYIKTRIQKLFNSFFYRNTDRIISVSEGSYKDFIKTFPFCKDKISVVPNGIDLGFLTPKTLFSAGDLNMVHVGGFTFEKNHHGLLRIFAEVRHTVPNARLWLIGEGPLKSTVEEEASSLGVLGSIEFCGVRHNVLDYIASANVLVLPSIIEGLPAVILESFYCRTPVVAYDVGGIAEVVKPGKTGWLLKAGDEAGFVAAVQEVLSSTKLDTIKDNAYNLVVTEFDNSVVAKRFLQVYQKMD